MITYPTWDKNAHWVRAYRARIRLGLERCRVCGCVNAWGTDRQLSLDHIWPRSRGGTSQMENATILCVVENNKKADGPGEYTVSLAQEEAMAPRQRRWSQRPVLIVPPGPWHQAQPPRTRRGQARALRRALPEWAAALYADQPLGEVPDFVMRLTEIK
jgi:hypothetical protein